jgi:hypothetical protein
VTRPIAALLAGWDRVFHAPSSGRRIGAVRILFAGYLLAYFGAMLPHVPQMFSSEGVYVPYRLPDYAPAPAAAWLMFSAMMGLTVALLLGYRTAVTAPLLLGSFLYHYFLQLAVKQSSFDRLIVVFLLVLCVADSGRVWGLDARRPGPQPTRWAERVLAIQLVLLYSGAGLWKLFNPAWHGGALLQSTFQGMFATPLAFTLVRQGYSAETWAALSWSIIAFELLLGPMLVARRTRPLGLLLGAGFHLGNCVLLVIPEFLVCIAAYPVFVRDDTLAALERRVRSAASFNLARAS